MISPFGNGTIQRFSANVSGMKQLAERDIEDIIQCSLPVFEDLLPELHNTNLLDILHTFGVFQAYTKLHLHTEDTLTTARPLAHPRGPAAVV